MEELDDYQYNKHVEQLRAREYPMLRDTTYLDHAGTTPYSKSLIERFSADMMSNLYGNPHSASPASQLSTKRIEDIRLRLLQFFKADPEDFDVVFVANATAGIKLVMEAFRGHEEGFWYGFHRDCHTSLVGVREVAKVHRCYTSDSEVESWISGSLAVDRAMSSPALFAYPAQSNMNGRRLPWDWCFRIRSAAEAARHPVYTLLDAAALVSTSPLDLSNAAAAPDFTVVSLYKIFGFPDLGALIVRKASGAVLKRRRYFGGGTVDMVVCLKEQWHAKKSETLHDQLEDGTLPIHNIMALGSAMDVHQELFGSLDRISRHTAYLAKKLHDGLVNLRHANGSPVCKLYKDPRCDYSNGKLQGPVLAFNLRNSQGAWVSNQEVERLATIKNIHIRTGGLCNPGGIAASLGLAPWEMKANFSAGQRCGNENDIMGGKPTGMIRVSLGAMSTMRDVDVFLDFVREFFVDDCATAPVAASPILHASPFHVESLTVYPIKSCTGWAVPTGVPWEVRKEGLVWDREWCLLHQGTGAALSQKRYPKMALIRPTIDLAQGVLRVRFAGDSPPLQELVVSLSNNPDLYLDTTDSRPRSAKVCGDTVITQVYKSASISDFFTQALGVACQLARFPAAGSSASSLRHSKAHLAQHQHRINPQMPGAYPDARPLDASIERPILLSNESPILLISRSSLNRLNEQIKAAGGKAAQAEAFRANVVVAEDPRATPGAEQQPYAEDQWRYLRIGGQYFQVLGACRRCQMVCVDQETGGRSDEPFVTLAKTRRFDGKVFFGQHMCHLPVVDGGALLAQNPTVVVGDPVQVLEGEGDVGGFA